jgi:hypothetical protein
MEQSILDSTKKVLGITSDYTAFDLDIVTFVNSAFSNLGQLGVGSSSFAIEDATAKWSELNLPQNQLSMVRTYIFLKTRLMFDPPTTSYLIEAVNKQIQEHEWRFGVLRDENLEEEAV